MPRVNVGIIIDRYEISFGANTCRVFWWESLGQIKKQAFSSIEAEWPVVENALTESWMNQKPASGCEKGTSQRERIILPINEIGRITTKIAYIS